VSRKGTTGELTVRVADVTVSFISRGIPLEVSDPYPRFLVQDGKADILMRVHYGALPRVALGEKLYDTGTYWKLHRGQGKLVFSFASPFLGPVPYCLAVVSQDFSQGDLYFRARPDDPEQALYPMQHPIDELLMVNYLSQGKGLNIHACGVDPGGVGLAFVGVSGAGKSTIARFWQERGATILSHDRLIVRKQDGHFFIHGTPWHGDPRACLPAKAPLARLYFLKQAPENYIQPLAQAEASRRLLVRCFPPFYLAQGMEFVLGFIEELTRQVPCYELGFLPDDSAVEMVLQHDGIGAPA